MTTLIERLKALGAAEIEELDRRITQLKFTDFPSLDSIKSKIDDLTTIQQDLIGVCDVHTAESIHAHAKHDALTHDCERLNASIDAHEANMGAIRNTTSILTIKVAELQKILAQIVCAEEDAKQHVEEIRADAVALSDELSLAAERLMRQYIMATNVPKIPDPRVDYVAVFDQLRPMFSRLMWDNIAAYIEIQNYYTSIRDCTYTGIPKDRPSLYQKGIGHQNTYLHGFEAVHSYVCAIDCSKYDPADVKSPAHVKYNMSVVPQADPQNPYTRGHGVHEKILDKNKHLIDYYVDKTICPLCRYSLPLAYSAQKNPCRGRFDPNCRCVIIKHNLPEFNAWLQTNHRTILRRLITNEQLLFVLERTTYDELFTLFALPAEGAFHFMLMVAFYGNGGKYCDLFHE